MVSQSELSISLRQQLKKDGVVEQLTARLRADLVNRMKNHSLGASLSSATGPGNISGDGNKENKAKPLTLEDRAVRSLILNYLKESSLNHSLSVFAPESGVSHSVLSSEESLKSLGFSELSPTYKDVTSSSEQSTLTKVLGHIASISSSIAPAPNSYSNASSFSASSSKTPSASESLVKKLNALQKQHDDAIHHTRVNPDKTLEDKMLNFQKECEDRLTKQMQRDLERVRKHDIEMMRLEEQAGYRGELQALRMEMKAEYDLRTQKAEEVQERKFQNSKLKSQQLEAAQYQARQEVVRELEAVRRRELDNRRELDIRKSAMELDEQRLSNLKQTLEGKEGELERMETSMKHKYQGEFERAREEAKRTYTAANDAIAAQQKTFELEISNVKRERESLRKFKEDLAEKHSSVLNNDQDVGAIMMERDSLKVRLTECESQLQAFHIQYEEEHKDDDVIQSLSPVNAPTRSKNLSTSSNPMSRSWRDHRNALESDLERCERELEETKHLLESEKSTVDQLREKERSTFEKAATLEAVAESLKQRLDEAEKKVDGALAEKEAIECESDAMKTELSEMRQLMVKQQNLVDMASRSRKKGTESKDSAREARLERVRQRAMEQMKNDTGILVGGVDEKREEAAGSSVAPSSAAPDASATKIVWDNGRPIAVAWDSKIGGLVLQQPAYQQAPAAAAPASTAASQVNSEAIAKLEARLVQTEMSSSKFEVLLEAEREKSKTQLETFSMMRAVMGQGAPMQQYAAPTQQVYPNQQQQARPAPIASTAPTAPISAQLSSPVPAPDLPPPPPPADFTISPVSKLPFSPKEVASSGGNVKSAGWEKEYEDYLVEQDATVKSQSLALKKKQEELDRGKAELVAREEDAERKKRAADEEKMLREEEDKAAAALKEAEEEEAEKEERERREKVKKEEEEKRAWEAKELARREKKRQSAEKDKWEKERKAGEEEKRRQRLVQQHRAALKIQAHRRRQSASIIYRDLLKEKRENMGANEKEKLEKEKALAVEEMREKKAEDAKRAVVEKEHEEARQRAVERMRQRVEREADERRQREEEEKRDRRMSDGGGGTDSDQLEVSDGSMESFSSDNYDDW